MYLHMGNWAISHPFIMMVITGFSWKILAIKSTEIKTDYVESGN